MAKVTGIGGVFIKARDPDALRAWYRDRLGIELDDWGGACFRWQTPAAPAPEGMTVWSVFEESSTYFDPSPARIMINYRVDDLAGILAQLADDGARILAGPEHAENGSFAWVLDPDGNKVELWEPLRWDEKNKHRA